MKGLTFAGPSDSRVLEAEATMLSLSEAGHFDLTLTLDMKVVTHSGTIPVRIYCANISHRTT